MLFDKKNKTYCIIDYKTAYARVIDLIQQHTPLKALPATLGTPGLIAYQLADEEVTEENTHLNTFLKNIHATADTNKFSGGCLVLLRWIAKELPHPYEPYPSDFQKLLLDAIPAGLFNLPTDNNGQVDKTKTVSLPSDIAEDIKQLLIDMKQSAKTNKEYLESKPVVPFPRCGQS